MTIFCNCRRVFRKFIASHLCSTRKQVLCSNCWTFPEKISRTSGILQYFRLRHVLMTSCLQSWWKFYRFFDSPSFLPGFTCFCIFLESSDDVTFSRCSLLCVLPLKTSKQQEFSVRGCVIARNVTKLMTNPQIFPEKVDFSPIETSVAIFHSV